MQVIPLEIYEDLEELEPKTKSVILKLLKFLGEMVRREDFLALKSEMENLTKAVAELAEAQKRTNEELKSLSKTVSELSKTVSELAEAQKRTDEELKSLSKTVSELSKTVAELAEAQKRTDEELKSLSKTVAELAEAQKRTDEELKSLSKTVAELAEAQKRTEKALAELAESHKKLVEEHRVTRTQLGGLAHTVGYFLENEAYKHLPKLLKRDFNLEVEGRLYRDYVEIGLERYEEVNILGRGRINGETVVILGEAKTQLKKEDVDKFLRKVQKLEKVYPGKKVLLVVTHQATPQVRKYAMEKGLKVYFSYEFD